MTLDEPDGNAVKNDWNITANFSKYSYEWLICVSSFTLPDLSATVAQQYYANRVEECRKF